MTTRTFTKGSDTHVRSAAPSSAYFTARTMAVRLNAAFGFIFFSRPIPLGATASPWTLKVYSTSLTGTGTATLRLRKVLYDATPATYSSMTWNTRPEVSTTYIDSTGARPVAGGREWTFDVTAFVQTIADGGFYRGWRIETLVDADWSVFSFDSELPPILEGGWSDAPDAPTRLSPAGGRAVSISHPVLRFDYTDVSGT